MSFETGFDPELGAGQGAYLHDPHVDDGVDACEGVTAECVRFQLDLSCLVDGELDEVASARAITHLEACALCNGFFQDVRAQVLAHKDLASADDLVERYRALVGQANGATAFPGAAVETIQLVQRLASIFYQLGKAYVLTGAQPGYREELFANQSVFEDAVPVTSTKNRGRGFVDGVLERGRGDVGGVDWSGARHMLNGQLETIESPTAKGRRLLGEALQADPTYEEPRLYLAFLDAKEGKRMKASRGFRHVFETGVSEANRAHAAIQLGLLYEEEEEFQKALACNRWVLMSGVEARDERFYPARFNVGMYYAHLARPERSIAAFRALLDHHPRRVDDVVALFRRSPKLRAAIEMQPGFAEALVESCPELFAEPLSSTQSNTSGPMSGHATAGPSAEGPEED